MLENLYLANANTKKTRRIFENAHHNSLNA
jgi:hypothetical protein